MPAEEREAPREPADEREAPRQIEEIEPAEEIVLDGERDRRRSRSRSAGRVDGGDEIPYVPKLEIEDEIVRRKVGQ